MAVKRCLIVFPERRERVLYVVGWDNGAAADPFSSHKDAIFDNDEVPHTVDKSDFAQDRSQVSTFRFFAKAEEARCLKQGCIIKPDLFFNFPVRRPHTSGEGW